MRKWLSLILALAMIASIGLPAFAQDGETAGEELEELELHLDEEEEDDDDDGEGSQEDEEALTEEKLEDDDESQGDGEQTQQSAALGSVSIDAMLRTSQSVSLDSSSEPEPYRPRMVATTDGEIDDMDSFVRLLLYSNELDIQGLVYSSARMRWAGNGDPDTVNDYTGWHWMQYYIDRYAEVYDNLLLHDPNYPEPDYLKSVIRIGNIEAAHDMAEDTPGSDLIKELLLDDVEGELQLQAWGGTNTIARALKSIEDEYANEPEWEEIQQKINEKAVIYIIMDQDNTYGDYISASWPDIKIIYNRMQFWSIAWGWHQSADEILEYLSGPFNKEHIAFNHGPLMDEYMLYGDGHDLSNMGTLLSDHKFGDDDHPEWGSTMTYGEWPQQRTMVNYWAKNQYDFISEGDTPSYLFALDRGLRSHEGPSYGGWSGRYQYDADNSNVWTTVGVEDYDFYSSTNSTNFPTARWIPDMQREFAARADWCVMTYEEANHSPEAVMLTPLDITAAPGQTITLLGDGTDPDGDELTFNWWQYVEAGTYNGSATISGENSKALTVTIPENAAKGETLHFIFEVRDIVPNDLHSLVSYQRVIVTVGEDDDTYSDALDILIEQAEKLVENLDKTDFTADTWKKLEEALEEAKAVADNTDATQEEITEAVQALWDALEALEALTMRGKLSVLIAQAAMIDAEAYTAASYGKVSEAMNEAIALVADTQASDEALQAAFDALMAAIEALEEKTVTPPPPTTTPSRSRSGGGNGGSNVRTPDAAPAFLGASAAQSGPVNQATVVAQATQALKNSATADVKVSGATTVSAATLKALSDAATAAGGTVRLLADTLNGGAVQGRLYITPSANTLSGDIKLGVFAAGNETDRIAAQFRGSYSNPFAAVHVEQAGFGMSVQAAVKVDLSALNTATLRFHRYGSDGALAEFAPDGVYVDANGYLHFNLERGGDIVITDGPLAAN